MQYQTLRHHPCQIQIRLDPGPKNKVESPTGKLWKCLLETNWGVNSTYWITQCKRPIGAEDSGFVHASVPEPSVKIQKYRNQAMPLTVTLVVLTNTTHPVSHSTSQSDPCVVPAHVPALRLLIKALETCHHTQQHCCKLTNVLLRVKLYCVERYIVLTDPNFTVIKRRS